MGKKGIVVLDKGRKEMAGPTQYCCVLSFLPFRG